MILLIQQMQLRALMQAAAAAGVAMNDYTHGAAISQQMRADMEHAQAIARIEIAKQTTACYCNT